MVNLGPFDSLRTFKDKYQSRVREAVLVGTLDSRDTHQLGEVIQYALD